MFKRKLFKRALPLILSVAMVFQSMPATAMAAESTTEPETVIEETTDEIVVDDGDDNEAADGQDDGANEESAPADNTGTEESKSSETQTTAEESESAENTTQAHETEEETQAAETNVALEEETADDQEVSKAVLSVDEDTLVNNLGGYTYDYTTGTVEKSFIPDSTQTAQDVLAAAKEAITVTVDEKYNSTAVKHVTYKWQQKGGDGNFADMTAGELPQAAGEYRIVISLGDVEGVCAAADDVAVDLIIKKATLTVDVDQHITPGTTVADAKKSIEDSLGLKLDGTRYDKDAYASTVSVEIKEASGTEALKDDVTLEKNKDYVFTVNVTLKDAFAKNYEVENETYNVILRAAVETQIKITYKPEDAMLHKLYGEAIDIAKDVTPYYEAKVTYKNADGEDTEVPNAQITATWCDAEFAEYTDEKFVPTEAGTYYYKLSYTDEKGTYKDAEAYIPFVIDAIDIVIVPELKETKYNDGTEAGAITKNAAYKVYQIKDGKPDTSKEVSRDEYFWGVAYNENKENDGLTQYYEPVFVVQRGEENEDKTITWTTLEDYDTLDATSEDGKITYQYRLVFSGKKAVYCAYGFDHGTDRDINASQKNYSVDVADATIGDNAVAIEITAPVTIDVSGIFKDNKAGESYDNAIISTYTGESIYETKNEYKKAVAKAGDETVAQNADSRLIYTWYYKDGMTTDEDGNVVPNWEYGSQYNAVEYYSAPTVAGEFRLKVEYADSANGVYSKEPAYVYYTILPQDAMAVLTPSPKQVYMDGSYTTEDFLRELQCTDQENADTFVNTAIYTVVDGKKSEDISERSDFDDWYGYSSVNPDAYYVVERKIDEGEHAGEWIAVDETFISGKSYRLNVYPNDEYDDYNDYNFGNELDKHGNIVNGSKQKDWNETIEIQELATQGIELKIDLDESLITDNIKTYDAKPFDLTELKKLVKVTEVKTGNAVGEDKAPLKYEFVKQVYDEDAGKYVDTEIWNAEYAIHGGAYQLRISIDTNDTYKGVTRTFNTSFVIKPRELTVTPVLLDEIKANLSVYNGRSNVDIITDYQVDGFVGEDNVDLIKSLTGYICDKNEGDPTKYTGWLRSGETYYIASEASFKTEDDEGYSLFGGRDYVIVDARATFVPVRAEATVAMANCVSGNTVYYGTSLHDTLSGTPADGYTHTITTREGIRYVKNLSVTANGKSKTVEGNFLIFDINAPAEFSDSNSKYTNNTFVFENSINSAGGYVLARYAYCITVAFEADREKLSENKTFEILWDTDYSEKFVIDFSKSILEDDMSKAVAPKSLAFNGASTKMVVGETQQLDVKVTKAQMSDIIMLGYQSSDEKVLKVTGTGYVTALSKGTATIDVYPCRKVDGEIIAIAGAKAATVKITVADVAAPKITKVNAYDTGAYVYYQKPANGYRREVYVLEGKQNADAFETAIAAVKNGDYSAFVYADLDDYEDIVDSKKNTVSRSIENLEPQKEYTVYVRNVSGLRALEDGSKVATSHTGAVKTFKTTKAMNEALDAYFDADLKGQTAFWDAEDEIYYAKLSDKSAQLSVSAAFYEKYSQSYSDEPDYIWRTLPLSKDDKNNYTDPKLSYYVSTGGYYNEDDLNDDEISWFEENGWYHFGGRLYEPTDLATVDKKGKVSFKGKGYVAILAYDAETEHISNYVPLYIDASPTSIKAKNIKMTVGQAIYLKDYLEYKEGKNTLVAYEDLYADLSIDKESDAYFTIEPLVRNDGSVYDYKITSLKPGGKLDLTVTDWAVDVNKGQPAKAKITSSVVNPVKSLKVKQATDQWFVATFSYPLPNYEFRFDLKDQRGDTIQAETRTIYYYGESTDRVVDCYDNTDDYCWYNTKTKQYEYVVWFTNKEITRLSNYNLTVTALYGEEASKEAKLKVKTTNIPASYVNLQKDDIGGIHIEVGTKNNGSIKLGDAPVLKSGNTYTLEAYCDNNEAKQRKTDTLTWKSTNTKVATIKANAGSYTATLKTLNKGITTIEVTSKLTKKVIARYKVRVNAVGDADGYFGDNEPYKNTDEGIGSGVDVEEKDMVEITMNNPITSVLNKGERQWFVFTAPAYGHYTVTGYDYIYAKDENGKYEYQSNNSFWLEKGAKRYIAVENDYSNSATKTTTVSGTIYTDITLGENKVRGNSYARFIAPADNLYTIYYNKDGKDTVLNDYKDVPIEKNGWIEFWIPSGATVVKITSLQPVAATVGGEGTAVSLGVDDEKWFSFTAEETGQYTFSAADASGYVSGSVYSSLAGTSTYDAMAFATAAESTSATYTIDTWQLDKGDTVYIKLSSTAATKDQAVTAKLKVEKADSIGADGKVEGVKVGTDYKTITYVVPSDGTYRYTFSTATEGAKLTSMVGDETATNNVYEGYFSKNDFVYIYVKADKEATVNVTVEKTSIKQLVLGDNTVNVAANAWERVEFYATESAWYTFKYDPEIASKETIFLTPGQKWSRSITSDKTQDVKLTITKEAVNALSNGDVSVSAGETKYYKYTAAKEGLYNFRITPDTGITAAQSDSLNGTYTAFANGEVYMTAGETFYVRFTGAATVAENAKATVAISSVEVTPITAGTTKPAMVAAGESKWLEFTSKKTARYEYKKENADGFDISWSSSLGGNETVESFSDSLGKVHSAGTKRYFKVTNNNAEEKEIKLTISEITPVAAETGASLKNGEGKWFVFTSTEEATTNYSFEAEAKAEGKKPTATITSYAWNKLDNQANTYNGSGFILKSGQSIYFYVQATTTDGDYEANVTVKATKAGVDGDITAAAGIAFAAGETKSLIWTVPEGKDGYYSLSAKVGDAVATGLTVICHKNFEQFDIGNSITNGMVKLEAGDTLKFKITSSVEQTVKFSMDETPVTPITAEGETISMKSGDVKYFSLAQKDVARYFIETTDIAEGLTLSYGNVSGTPNNNSFGNLAGGYYTFVGKINGEYVFKITANVEGKDAKTFIIKGGVVTATDLKDSATIAKADVQPNHYTWYKFTAAEDARYTFKLKNASARVASSLNYDNGTYGFPWQPELKKGDVLYFAVYNTVKPEEDITLSVAKTETTEISEAKPLTIDITKVEAKEKVWVTFTAPKDGKYVFEADAENIMLFNAGSYYKCPYTKTLNEGDKVTYAFYYPKKPEKNITISVKELVVTNVTTTPTTVSVKNGETKYFTFKETEDVRYYIETSELAEGLTLSVANPNGTYNNPVGDLNKGYYSFVGTAKGEFTFALQATFTGDGDKTGEKTFKIQSGVVETKALSVGTPVTIKKDDVKPGRYTWYKLVIPEYSRYIFKLDNAKAFYNTSGENYAFNSSMSFPYETVLYSGQTYYFAVVSDEKPAEDVVFSVNRVVPVELKAGVETAITFDANEYKYFSFTADTSVVCSIKTVDSSNVKFSRIYEDYEDYSDVELCDIVVPAGETVMFRATNTGDRAEVKIILSISSEIISLDMGNNEIDFAEAGSKWVSYIADLTGWYSLSSKNADLEYYGQNGLYSESHSEWIESGNKVFAKVTADSALKAIVTVAVPVPLTLDSPKEVSVGVDDDYWFEFVAPSDGTYTFYSLGEDDTYVYVYENDVDINHNDDDGQNNNFSVIQTLAEGDIVYLRTYGYNHSSAQYTVYAVEGEKYFDN